MYSSALLALSEAFGRILQSITELKEQSRYVRDFMDFVQSNSTSGENISANGKIYPSSDAENVTGGEQS